MEMVMMFVTQIGFGMDLRNSSPWGGQQEYFLAIPPRFIQQTGCHLRAGQINEFPRPRQTSCGLDQEY